MVRPLEGFTIGVTADRRREEQAELLRRRGSTVMEAPCIRTLALGPEDGMRAATDALIADPPQFLVANTGIGIRSWFAAAAAWNLDGELVDALSGTRTLARGPKAAGALRTAGLNLWWQAPSEQLFEVAEHLMGHRLEGARVAIQLHGDDDQSLASVVRAVGAEAIEVPVYRWTLPEDPGPARRLIGSICAQRVDAVTFTAAPALRNLFALARGMGVGEGLRAAFDGAVVAACIGPVCAAAARAEGVTAPLIPGRWRLGALVRAVEDHLQARRHHLRVAGTEVLLQRGLVLVDGAPVRLSEREQAVIEALARRPGATVTRGALLREVWGSSSADPHVLDVTVARLRGKLGPAGTGIETALRRGYRIAADPRVTPPLDAS